MKKILTTLILGLLWCNISFADWEKILSEKSDIGNYTFYFDNNKIIKKNGYVYYWYLASFSSQHPERDYMSMLVYTQIDCKKLRGKDLKFSTHSKKMAKGKILSEHKPEDIWQDARPNSVREYTYNIICNKAD